MATRTHKTWQEELAGECQTRGYVPPQYNIVSDRRGGRTAWTATVTIMNALNIPARYWYDGQFVNNAKEDASEVACTKLRNPALMMMSMETGGGEQTEPVDEPMPEGAVARVEGEVQG